LKSIIEHNLGGNITDKSWKIVLALLIALTVSVSTLGAGSDFTLGIFGNANMDDTIDEKDVAYVEGLIKGTNAATNLSDANYDGKINAQDIDQIKLIIGGEEKKLTLEDRAGRVVTINMPVERIIALHYMEASVIRSLDANDYIVGVGDEITKASKFFPKLSKLPCVGKTWSPDPEAIILLEPDLVLFNAPIFGWGGPELVEALNPANITVFFCDFSDPPFYTDEVKKLAYILGKTVEGDEFIEWYESYINIIGNRTKELSESDKPRVFDTHSDWGSYGKDEIGSNPMIQLAGGINIAADLPGSWITVDPEWVINESPDIVILQSWDNDIIGYNVDNSSAVDAFRNDFISRDGAEDLDAVKNREVYVVAGFIRDRGWFIGVPYMAKLFHPELFEDLDPEAFHQEYLTRFQGLDYDLDKHGIFVYPPIEINGTLAGIPDE
jgi:iron complex transport system substrate-binding protein